MMRIFYIIFVLAVAALSFFAGTHWQGSNAINDNSSAPVPAALESQIISQASIKQGSGDWGSIAVYTPESTVSAGNASMLTAQLTFLPHQQLQPPHQHTEEEFSYIIEGTGTWSLNGIDSEIKPGDLMYIKPQDIHGIKNTSEKPLKFFVMKWQSKKPE